MFFTCLFSQLLVLLSIEVMSQSVQVIPLTYVAPSSCEVTEFYHYGNLSCVSCPSNAIQSSDGLSCVCNDGFKRNLTTSIQCQQCGDNTVVSREGVFCLQCQSPLLYNNGQCTGCNRTSIFVDILPMDQSSSGQRTCVSCPLGTWADSSKSSCVPCGVSDCSICTGSKVVGEVCFTSDLSLPPSQPFLFYTEFYSFALELCNNGNETACQLLLNLCVLQSYDKQDAACRQSIQLASSRSYLVLPLYYPQFGADEYLANTIINKQFTTTSTAESSKLQFVAVSFALNGSFLGLINITDQIMLCKERTSRSVAAWLAGVHYEINCLLDPQELHNDGSDPIFYDLLVLLDSDIRLIPIPILMENYRDNTGATVNQGNNVDQWQFVRRFFLSQSITNRPLYAQSINIRVTLKSGGYIDPPYLRIIYQSIPTTDNNIRSSFSVHYNDGGNSFNIGLAVTAALLVVMTTIYTGFKVNGFMRRNGNTCCELKTFIFLIVQFCSITSSLFLLLITVAGVFWVIFFKAQLTLFIALPVGNQEIAFIILLVLAFLFRFLEVIYLIWKQTTINIFFIDWEKPKTVSNSQTLDTVTPPAAVSPSVSIWRTYFIANEWNEIQTLRKTTPILILVITLLFLEAIGLQNLAEREPSSHITTSPERYSAPHSHVLRFGLAVLFYIVFAVISRLYMVLIHERYIEDKIQQFIDLCSISNVSVFILSYDLYGHYIHGRSVHGHADTNMREMNENLIKEKEDMCGKRGLLPDTDEQTFEVAVTQTFKIHYNKNITALQAERAEGQTNIGVGGQNERRVNIGEITDTRIKTYEELTHFLSSFIEHSIPNCDYVVKRKLLLERAIGMEFYDPVDRSLFYTDLGLSFTDVLFYGHEWSLLSLEMLLFLLTDLAAENFVLAAVITYVISQILSLIRDGLGKRNLGKKTLVDNRFLI